MNSSDVAFSFVSPFHNCEKFVLYLEIVPLKEYNDNSNCPFICVEEFYGTAYHYPDG